MQKKVCWECGQSRHIKRDCPNKACSLKNFESDANVVSMVTEDDNLFH